MQLAKPKFGIALIGMLLILMTLAVFPGNSAHAEIIAGPNDITQYWSGKGLDYSDAANVTSQYGGDAMAKTQIANPNSPLILAPDSVSATNLNSTSGAKTAPAITSKSVVTFTFKAGDTVATRIFGDAEDDFTNFLMSLTVTQGSGSGWFDLTSPGVTVTADGTKLNPASNKGGIPISAANWYGSHAGNVLTVDGGTITIDKDIKIVVDMSKVTLSNGKKVDDTATSLAIREQFANSHYGTTTNQGILKMLVGTLQYTVTLTPKITDQMVLPANANGYFAILTGTIQNAGDSLQIGVAGSNGTLDTSTAQKVTAVGDNKWMYLITDAQAKAWGLTRNSDGTTNKKIVVVESQPKTANTGDASSTISGAPDATDDDNIKELIQKITDILDKLKNGGGVSGSAIDEAVSQVGTAVQQTKETEDTKASGYALTLTVPGSQTAADFMFTTDYKNVTGTPILGSPSDKLDWQLTKDGKPVTGVALSKPTVSSTNIGNTNVLTTDVNADADSGTLTANSKAFEGNNPSGVDAMVQATFTVNGQAQRVLKQVHIISLKPEDTGDTEGVVAGSDYTFKLNETPASLTANTTPTWGYAPKLAGWAGSENQNATDNDGNTWTLDLGNVTYMQAGDLCQMKVTFKDGKTTMYSNVAMVKIKPSTGPMIYTVPAAFHFSLADGQGNPTGKDPNLTAVIPGLYGSGQSLSATGGQFAFGVHNGGTPTQWGIRAQLENASITNGQGDKFDNAEAAFTFKLKTPSADAADVKQAGVAQADTDGVITSNPDLALGNFVPDNQAYKYGSAFLIFSGTSTGDFDLYGDLSAQLQLGPAGSAKAGTYTATIDWSTGVETAESMVAAR
ncbi:autotransporter outer membrane beta-barrel domain-containing protein [Lacticaseibacillus sp. GG6-2]